MPNYSRKPGEPSEEMRELIADSLERLPDRLKAKFAQVVREEAARTCSSEYSAAIDDCLKELGQ